MRDRLIELITKSHCVDTWNYHTDDFKEPNPIEKLADCLLENGVIVPPCKVGDVVYQYSKKHTRCTPFDYTPKHIDDSECLGCCAECDSKSYDFLFDGIVTEIKLTEDGIKVRVNWKEKWDNSAYEIGKTVFLTREEAENALRKEDA